MVNLSEKSMEVLYSYEVVWFKIVDGDSIHLKVQREVEVEVDFGFHVKDTLLQTKTYQSLFRLQGINTPEIRGEERPEGLVAKEYFKNLMAKCHPIDGQPTYHVLAVTHKPDKYGRWLVTLYLEEYLPGEIEKQVRNVNLDLVASGQAQPYKTAEAIADPLQTGVASPGILEDFLK